MFRGNGAKVRLKDLKKKSNTVPHNFQLEN